MLRGKEWAIYFAVSSLIKPVATIVLPETRNLVGGGCAMPQHKQSSFQIFDRGNWGKRLEKGRQEVWEKDVTRKLVC